MKWLDIVKMVLPIVLGAVNPGLAPLGGLIANGIGEAEAIPGATGPQKLQHVVDLATTGAESLNAGMVSQGKGPVVDPMLVSTAAAAAISAAVDVANIIHQTALVPPQGVGSAVVPDAPASPAAVPAAVNTATPAAAAAPAPGAPGAGHEL